jgi:hypothetical protein
VLRDDNQYAKSRIQALHVSYEQLQGKCDIRHLSTGGLFTLMNHPQANGRRTPDCRGGGSGGRRNLLRRVSTIKKHYQDTHRNR